jgi:hypothetical protein
MTVSELMDKLSKMSKYKEVLIFTLIDYENPPCGEFYESISGVIEDKNWVVISHE